MKSIRFSLVQRCAGGILLSLLLAFSQTAASSQDSIPEISLEQAIRVGQANSPQIKLALLDYKESLGEYHYHKANYLPQLSLSGTFPDYNRAVLPVIQPDGSQEYREVTRSTFSTALSLSQNIGLTGGQVYITGMLERIDNLAPVANTIFSTSPRIGIIQPLFGFNKLKWDKIVEPVRLKEAKLQYVQALESIAVAVTEQYFLLIKSKIHLETAEANAQSNSRLLSIAQQRFNLGKIDKSELLQLEMALLNAKQQVLDASYNMQREGVFFNLLLGYPADVTFAMSYPGERPNNTISTEEVIAQAIENSPLYLTGRLNMLESERSLAEVRAETGVRLTLQGNAGISKQSSTFQEILYQPQDQQSFSLSFSVPVVDWGRQESKRMVAKANQQKTKIATDEAIRQLREEVRFQLRQLHTLEEQIENAKLTDELGEQRYLIVKSRYEIGKMDVRDIIIAQSEKDVAKQNYLNLLQKYWITHFQIRRLTLFDFQTGTALTENLIPDNL